MKRVLLIAALLLTPVALFSQTNNISNIGLPPNGSFEGTGIESVQVNNGNLHIEIPLFTLPGRGVSVPISYVYDSKGWRVLGGGEGQTTSYKPAAGNQPAQQWRVAAPLIDGSGVTGGVSGQMSCPGSPNGNKIFITTYAFKEPNGTLHYFSPVYDGTAYGCGKNFNGTIYANDGSGYAIGGPGGLAPDGASFFYNGNATVAYVQDTNGNQLVRPLNGLNVLPPTPVAQSTLTDTLGRTVQVDATLNSQTGKYELKYYDSTGTQQTIIITKSPVTVVTHWCTPGITTCHDYGPISWQMPTEILLPNGMKYTITYTPNAFGTPASITLPTGATISYTWGTYGESACSANGTGTHSLDTAGPRVKTRTVTNGGQVATSTYTYNCGSYISQKWVETAVVTSPLGDDTLHTFTEMTQILADDISPTKETQTDYFSGPRASNILLKSVKTDYQDQSVGPNMPTAVTTTAYTPQGNLVTRVETDYDLFPNPASLTYVGNWFSNLSMGDVVEKREYAFGVGNYGALVRKTHFNYAHISGNTNYNSNYKTLNIVNRVTEKQVYDGSGNLVADAKTAYDGNIVGATAGVPNT